MCALDPVARHDFMATVLAAAVGDGVSVLLSSHVLTELERVADYLILLSRGRVQVAGEVDDLLASHRLLTGPAAEAGKYAERPVVQATSSGVDPSAAGLAAARQRAVGAGLAGRARFQHGTFEHTDLADATAGAVMSIDAFQYAPGKRAAFTELARIMRPGARAGIICFEVDPATVAGLPVFGADPVADYRPLMAAAGLTVEAYEETPGWAERVHAAFSAIAASNDTLIAEMGQRAAESIVAEAAVTIRMKPYSRRIMAVASRPG